MTIDLSGVLRSAALLVALNSTVSPSQAPGEHACSSPPSQALGKAWVAALNRALGAAPIGYTYALMRHGEFAATGAVGSTGIDVDGRSARPMCANARLQVASVSKSLTAVALLHVMESQRISLDTPIVALLRRFVETPGANVERITVRQLLQHRSGFPFSDASLSPRLDSTRVLLARPVPFTPGARFEYSNTNYWLARTILEQLTGREYEEYVRHDLLDPIGAGGIRLTPPDKPGLTYRLGDHVGDGKPLDADFRDDGGAYGWYATASELSLFLQAVRASRFLSPDATSRMLNDGLGWFSQEVPGGPAFYNEGYWNPGHRGIEAAIAILPDSTEAVLLLNTVGAFRPAQILLRAYSELTPRIAVDRTGDSTRVARVERPANVDAVRCTIDGTEPTAHSARYLRPFLVPAGGTVHCRGYRDNTAVTFTGFWRDSR